MQDLNITASIESLEHNLERQLSWIRASEERLKHAGPIALAMFGSLAVLIPEWGNLDGAGLFLFVPTVLLLLLFFLVSFFTLNPDLRSGGTSKVYFGDIAATDQNAFVEELLSLPENSLKMELARQIWVNACIASKKYERARIAMLFLVIATPLWASCLYLAGN